MMTFKISKVYKLAKNDKTFIAEYNEHSTDTLNFPFFPSLVLKGVVAAIYYGYLIGNKEYEVLNDLANTK